MSLRQIKARAYLIYLQTFIREQDLQHSMGQKIGGSRNASVLLVIENLQQSHRNSKERAVI